jgi:hypothetical protein
MNEEKILAIRYVIYRMVEEYKKYLNINSENFNKENNFTLKKCLYLPFIVTIANGKKEALVTGIFKDTFYPILEKWGGVIPGNIDNNEFNLYNDINLNLTFDNNKLIDDFNAIEFSNLSQNWKLYIDKSIEFLLLKEVRYPDFPTFNENILKKITMENFAFGNMIKLYSNKVMTEVELTKKFNFFVEKSRFFISSNPIFGTNFEWEIENKDGEEVR